MTTQDFTVRFTGQAFAGNVYDLRIVQQLKTNLRSITEQMVAIYLGRNELADELKKEILDSVDIENESLSVKVYFSEKFFRYFDSYDQGSIESTSSNLININDIVQIYFDAMTLRKFVAEAKLSGKPVKVLINTDKLNSHKSVTRTEKGNILLNHPKLLLAAQMTKQATDQILNLMKQNHIASFEVEGLIKRMFNQLGDFIVSDTKAELTGVASFHGRLDNIFFSKRRGVVIAEHEVYQIVWDTEMKAKIMEHADLEGVEFIVKPCVETHSFYGELVVYKVIDCQYAAQGEKHQQVI